MSESNNVRFVEDNGKWLWKRYDAEGSVIFRSPLFNTEREAREDYDINGSPSQESAPADTNPEETTAPENTEQTQESGSATAQELNNAGTADGEDQQQAQDDNTAGSASL